MRLVVQRVSSASVRVASTGKISGKIGEGLFVLIGVKIGDTKKDAEFLADKISKLRVMADENKKMNLTPEQILAVSQFTLYADTSRGNRPSFIGAATPTEALKIYEHFIDILKGKGLEVQTGSFGNFMEIDAKLDGPVTIILES